MKNIKNLQYWFTSAGNIKHSEKLEEYLNIFRERASKVEVINLVQFEILKLFNFPNKGLCTFLTKGYSSFILGNEIDGFIRQELSITVDSKNASLEFDKVLLEIADRQLNFRDSFSLLSTHTLSDKNFANINQKLNRVIIAGSVWFDEEYQGFIDEINTNIIELILVTANEEAEFIKSTENFIDKTMTNEINLLDIRRK